MIYLDLDGTLIDVWRKHYRLYADTLQELGYVPLAPGAYRARRRQGVPRELLLEGLHPSAIKEFARRWLAGIETPTYLAFDTLVSGARETLALLAPHSRLVLVTLRRCREALLGQLEALGLDGFFATVVAAGDLPQEELTKGELIQRTVPPDSTHALLVGDSEADVHAARELGITIVCVLTGVRGRSFLEALGPDHIVGSVVHLPRLLIEATG